MENMDVVDALVPSGHQVISNIHIGDVLVPSYILFSKQANWQLLQVVYRNMAVNHQKFNILSLKHYNPV